MSENEFDDKQTPCWKLSLLRVLVVSQNNSCFSNICSTRSKKGALLNLQFPQRCYIKCNPQGFLWESTSILVYLGAYSVLLTLFHYTALPATQPVNVQTLDRNCPGHTRYGPVSSFSETNKWTLIHTIMNITNQEWQLTNSCLRFLYQYRTMPPALLVGLLLIGFIPDFI